MQLCIRPTTPERRPTLASSDRPFALTLGSVGRNPDYVTLSMSERGIVVALATKSVYTS